MILLVSDNHDEVREIGAFLDERGMEVSVVSRKDFGQEGIRDKGLIIYSTEELDEEDILNIARAKKEGVPLILLIPYLPEDRLKEVSRLWKGGYLRDCFIKPVKMEGLLRYLPQGH